MKLTSLIEQLQKLNDETENAGFKKSIDRLINVLGEIENKKITNDEMVEIQTRINPYFQNIQNEEGLKQSLKKLRKTLTSDFGFVPAHYFLTLGIGVGLALGTALGVSFGVPFENGIVFGPMIGSGIGLIGGVIIGLSLDKKKESENRILKNL